MTAVDFVGRNAQAVVRLTHPRAWKEAIVPTKQVARGNVRQAVSGQGSLPGVLD